MFRTIIFKIALAVWFTLWAPLLLVALPSAWLTRRFMVTDAWGVLQVARIFAGIKYKIHNSPFANHQSPIASHQSPIIASKHMSILEVAALSVYVPNVFFILKRELMWIPIYGWAFARIGLQPVNRAAGATNMNRLVAEVDKKIRRGMTLAIFPEGTRAKPGQPIKIKRGLLFIAEQLNLPIIPVGTDSGKFWPKKGRMHPGTANIYFGPALAPTATLDEIAAAIQRRSA
ncbi:MAG: 1-acyl-sn-glycerol-3-phosphate acyltransferase [Proteobacteria bacterium]|nr:1-acyl-sn-glycerol-3-phosphate acyltransferase [Pseudomonadota bacterium]